MSEHIVDIGYYGVAKPNAIGWCGSTVNVIAGCTPAGPECDNCYAAAEAVHQLVMRKGEGRYKGLALVDGETGRPRWTGDLWLAPREDWVSLLDGSRPDVVFLGSMTDVFHRRVSDETLLFLFRVMYRAPWKVWQLCTKRAGRMAAFMSRLHERDGELFLADHPLPSSQQVDISNIWIGVTAGTNHSAKIRIPDLLSVKAAVRFVSMEPLLEAVDLEPYVHALDWVIVGGESEPAGNYRPMDVDWARAIRDLCVARQVPFFFKQRACRVATEAFRYLDNVLWRQLPRRELLSVPTKSERWLRRAWARDAVVPG